MNKNNSGFSLVELIVVIAIMAILAGIAVPTYSKYIAKANDTAVNAQLDEVKTAAFAALAAEGKTVSKITVTTNASGATTVTVNPAPTTAVTEFLDDGFAINFEGTSYADSADSPAGTVEWENNKWTEK